MLTTELLYEWNVYSLTDFIVDNPEVLEATRIAYKSEFEEFKRELTATDPQQIDEIVYMNEFIDEVLCADMITSFRKILETFVKHNNLASALCFVTYDESDDYYILSIKQVVPTEQSDLEEFIRVYMEKVSHAGLSDLVLDAILKRK